MDFSGVHCLRNAIINNVTRPSSSVLRRSGWVCFALGLGLPSSPPEHLLHVHCGLSQRVLLDMGVNVRRGLVVRMPDDLHGNQRIDATLIQQCHVIVPELYRTE